MRIMQQAKTHMLLHLSSLEANLNERSPWICGEQFTLADISWMVIFDRLIEADWFDELIKQDAYPNILRYWQDLQQRPSFTEGVDNFRLPIIERATKHIKHSKRVNEKVRVALTQ